MMIRISHLFLFGLVVVILLAISVKSLNAESTTNNKKKNSLLDKMLSSSNEERWASKRRHELEENKRLEDELIGLIETEILKEKLLAKRLDQLKSAESSDEQLDNIGNRKPAVKYGLKRGKSSHVRFLSGSNSKGYYTRPCLFNALSCYFFSS